MERQAGIVKTSLQDLVDPKHTALLIIDVQNDFCETGGVSDRHGAHLTRGRAIIDNIGLLIKQARTAGVLVIYVQNTSLPNRMSDSPAWLYFRMKTYNTTKVDLLPEVTLDQTWGQQIVEEIKPVKGDLVIKKYRSSAFVGTNLDSILRIHRIETLVITGLVTDGCVESTARDGLYHDYFIIVLRDCVDSTDKENHEAALRILARYFDIVTSDEIIRIWKQMPK